MYWLVGWGGGGGGERSGVSEQLRVTCLAVTGPSLTVLRTALFLEDDTILKKKLGAGGGGCIFPPWTNFVLVCSVFHSSPASSSLSWLLSVVSCAPSSHYPLVSWESSDSLLRSLYTFRGVSCPSDVACPV